jgi:hypothetical protein
VASVSISCPSCSAIDGVVRNGKSTVGHQRYSALTAVMAAAYTASNPVRARKSLNGHEWRWGRATARIMGVGLSTILRT